jgi:HD-like signal output (HDOD) protein
MPAQQTINGVAVQKYSTRQLIEHLTEIKRLPHMPQALLKLNRLLAMPDEVHVQRVAELIMQDQRLTAGLLKVVNSARYLVGKPTSHIGEAIARLGVNDLRVMALAINYGEAFSAHPRLQQVAYQKYCLFAAHLARVLAAQSCLKFNPYDAFMIGLMHEIGVYLLLQADSLDYEQVLDTCQGRVSGLVVSENKLLGFSHANLGARLLKNWEFSDEVVMGVLGHHAPHMLDKSHQRAAYLGYLAEAGAWYALGSNGVVEAEVGVMSSALQLVLKRIGLDEALYLESIEQATTQLAQSPMV